MAAGTLPLVFCNGRRAVLHVIEIERDKGDIDAGGCDPVDLSPAVGR